MRINNRILAGGAVLMATVALSATAATPTGERLRAIAERNDVFVGGCIGGGQWGEQGTLDVIKAEFNMMTPENEMKMQSLQYARGQYYWDNADRLVTFCQTNDIKVHGHCLLYADWGDPDWFKNLPLDEVESEMNKHIDAVMGRYKGRIHAWDVTNENTPQWGGSSGLNTSQNYYRAMGAQWMDKAFGRARAADPDAILIYNDNVHAYDGEGQLQTILDLVTGMKQRGVPIDAVGFQCHYYNLAQANDFARLATWFQRFADLGLKIYITEFDVALCGDYNLTTQGQKYRGLMDVFMAQPACEAFLMWGVYDGHSWLQGSGWGGCDGADPLPFDHSYTAKPAYYGLQAGLLAGSRTPDTQNPSVPTGVSATAGRSPLRIDVRWTASTDDQSVAGYDVYRDGVKVARVSGVIFSDGGLVAGTRYTYRVEAVDGAGKLSGLSAAVQATFPAPTSGDIVAAVNAGGPAFTATDGTMYAADAFVSGGTALVRTDPISGTTDQTLYQSERYGTFSYAFRLPRGNYEVTLKFAENYWDAAGSRSFDVSIEGTKVISALDLFSAASGKNLAYDRTFTVSLSDDTLGIAFTTITDNAKVNAIAIAYDGPSVTAVSHVASVQRQSLRLMRVPGSRSARLSFAGMGPVSTVRVLGMDGTVLVTASGYGLSSGTVELPGVLAAKAYVVEVSGPAGCSSRVVVIQ